MRQGQVSAAARPRTLRLPVQQYFAMRRAAAYRKLKVKKFPSGAFFVDDARFKR
jgi:predicted DNA-binding transcriptional regulator AlpA